MPPNFVYFTCLFPPLIRLVVVVLVLAFVWTLMAQRLDLPTVIGVVAASAMVASQVGHQVVTGVGPAVAKG